MKDKICFYAHYLIKLHIYYRKKLSLTIPPPSEKVIYQELFLYNIGTYLENSTHKLTIVEYQSFF